MNQQWLTTLLSKGIELEQNLRQQFQSAKEDLKLRLEDRGVRLNPADLAALVEEVSPKASHAALSYVLDLVRPFSAGMGLRVSRLLDTQIEMVLPARSRNLSESLSLHEGAIVTAGIEACKVLWSRHAPMGEFEILVTRLESTFFKAQTAQCRLRLELPETHRELILAALRSQRVAEAEAEVRVFDENDQAVANLHLFLKFKHTPMLNAKQVE